MKAKLLILAVITTATFFSCKKDKDKEIIVDDSNNTVVNTTTTDTTSTDPVVTDTTSTDTTDNTTTDTTDTSTTVDKNNAPTFKQGHIRVYDRAVDLTSVFEDLDNDNITIVSVSPTKYGTLNINKEYNNFYNKNSYYTYVPTDKNFAGHDTITIVVSDGTIQTTGKLSIIHGTNKQIKTYELISKYYNIALVGNPSNLVMKNDGTLTSYTAVDFYRRGLALGGNFNIDYDGRFEVIQNSAHKTVYEVEAFETTGAYGIRFTDESRDLIFKSYVRK